ncbi:MAG: beta-ketoacyl-ACP reductase [Pelagibacteraceae bacterium]|nr:beta-ketoacyl-ACP reductase [Pelagibacteraceae bacterium]|tara:strand:- start:16521 stop:17252 length:732 start_codon:yes stop_codon:yes gene_type:complete
MSKNNKILITGASGGIGSAICEKFIDPKNELILTSSSIDNLDKLKDKYGTQHHYYYLNLLEIEKLENNLKKISSEHKNISILVNNAGITDDSLILRMSFEKWSRVLQANLTSNYMIIKSILPGMIQNKYGKIIGVSSVVASTGNPGQSNYVASKSGMIGLYKSIALEVSKRNINVNLISPGFIKSPMTDKLNDIQKNKILDSIPMSKFGSPQDVANLVQFLTSENASYITGQNIHVNGGMFMA